MATKYWLGTAIPVAKVMTATVAGTLSGETFNILVNGKVMATHTDATTVIDDTRDALIAAWEAQTNVYATQITATAGGTGVVILTADNDGEDFLVTVNTPGGSATFTLATPTANAGPHVFDIDTNWSTGAKPANGDDLIIENSAISICYGLAQSGITLNSLQIRQSYTGRIGLKREEFSTAADGETTDAEEAEYRDLYLTIKVDASSGKVIIGDHQGPGFPAGSQRIMLDLGNTAAAVEIVNTATSSADAYKPTVRLQANHSNTDITVRQAPGGLGIAVDNVSETSLVGDVRVTAPDAETNVHIGPGATLTNFYQQQGDNTLNSSTTLAAVEVSGGTLRTEGDWPLTALTQYGGMIHANHVYSGGNAIGTANLHGGTLEGRHSGEARTWATVNRYPGAVVNLDTAVVTITTFNQKGPTSYQEATI